MIRAAVDVVLDKVAPFGADDEEEAYAINDLNGPLARKDSNVDELIAKESRKEELKEEITTVVGAVLTKQQCYEKTACKIGKKASNFAGKDLLFM